MSIKIPVSADFNGDDIKKQIAQINAAMKQMGDTVAKANGQKFEPITLRGKVDLKYFVAQSEKLLKIQGELKNRMVKSGQSNKNPVLANWNQMYLNEATRLRRQQEMLVFLGGSFEDVNNPPKPGRPSSPPPANRVPPGAPPSSPVNPWVRQGTKILQSGLNAAGPVGGVASGALGTGMSAGFGAGLMGLLGGVVALGVGKIVGGVMEKIDQAEQNNITYDRLKRTLGDVNVSFEGLKSLIHDSGNNLAITFDEAGKLSVQFAKLANLSDDQYQQLAPELSTGVGLARGFGLDPSQTMGLLGGMRGMRITGSDQDSRRMALLIGETIGKSGAFAKADEVMEAIGNYATVQTRQSLSAANVSGYTGTFSALAGSGIPGLDPAGAGGMLSRINASLSAGGAHGEASQFFTSMVANRMGLDPIQMAILREGGAFATNNKMFGDDSIAARFGIKGPSGTETYMQTRLNLLRDKYGDETQDQRKLLAMSTSNDFGIGINQAMALLSVNPNEMGGLQRGLSSAGIDMSTLNSSGIANLAKVYTGSDSDRQSVANSLQRRTGKEALTSAESDMLRTVMAGNDVDAQKKMLAELVATRDQERTTGSDVRDSKNLLDNIKTSLADKLVPLMTEMRHGIMFMAGVGKNGTTPRSIQEDVIRAEGDDKADQIKQRYQAKIDEKMALYNEAKANSVPVPMGDELTMDRADQLAATNARAARHQQTMKDLEGEMSKLKEARDKELGVNQSATDSSVEKLRTSGINADTVAKIESGNRDYDKNGNLITSPKGAMGRMQVMPGTARDPGFGVTPARDDSPEELARVGRDLLGAMDSRYGNTDQALAAYNAGPGRVDKLIAKYGDDWLSHAPAETQDYIRKYHKQNVPMSKDPAQLPSNDTSGPQSNASVSFAPLTVVHTNEKGEVVRPPEQLQPFFQTPWKRN